MPRLPLRLAAAVLLLVPFSALAHAPGEEMAAAANAWLESLDAGQRARATFALKDDERENWHFVPQARKGLTLGEMNAGQRQKARGILAAGLSHRGLLQTDAIIALEEVLHAVEGTARRNPDLYYFSVFGEPVTDGSWGWRVEGHHLSVNFTIVDGHRVAVTPLFFGSNPAEVRIEHPQKGKRALAGEEDLGRAFMLSLSTTGRAAALFAQSAPRDIITANDRKARAIEPAGIRYPDLTAEQKQKLRELVRYYADRLRGEIADAEMQKIADRGWDNVRFAWAGGLGTGDGHYYRIHGPGFVIEYDKTQDSANHIHTVWRDFEGDFGRDLLREHYENAHRK